MASPLTPAVRLWTNAPFPTFRNNEETGEPELCSSLKDKVLIQSCAEFMTVDVAGSTYGTSADFILLHDLEGQPIVLSIGTDKRLYLCAHVNGASGSWQVFDISPSPEFEASVYDASNSPDSKTILIAVSGRESTDKTKTKVYQVIVDCPKLVADENGVVQGLPPTKLPWAEKGGVISTREIKTLVCEYFGEDIESEYQIVAGVAASTKREGSHFIHNPTQGEDWTLVKFPQQVETIRSVVPANLPALGPGYVVLFEDDSTKRAVSCLYHGDGITRQVYLTGLQNPRKLFANVNMEGYTDLLVAADNGIGFIDVNKMLEEPMLLLEGIACSNVLASESAVSGTDSTLVVYANSSHGELFVVEGSQKSSANGIVEFPLFSIPFPIRSDVRNISGGINPATGAFETVYVSKDRDSLKHLARDPITSMWKETEIVIKSDASRKKIRTPAFLVTVALTNGKGTPVPAGYQVQLTSSPTLVYINDRSYNLDRRPQAIPVNEFGKLQVVIPSADSLGAAPIVISLMPETGESRTFDIQPAQRILHTMGSLNTGDALKNAKTSDNRPFFSNAMKQKHGDKFNQAADVFAKVPQMVASTGSDGRHPIPGGDESISIAWQKDDSGASSSSSGWMSQAVDAAGEVLGDVIEYLKQGVKFVVKIGLKIVGPIVRLILKIGARVIRFVLDSVSSIVTSLSFFLEGVFGIDLSSVREWFSFRYKRVEATQKEFASIINNGLMLTSRYLHHNHNVLEGAIDGLGKFFESYVSRPYSYQPLEREESEGSSILDNPIIANLLKFNPLGWIMEATADELGDDFKIPSLDLNIGGQILEMLRKQLILLMDFAERSRAGFKAAIGQPQSVMNYLLDVFRDGFWTIFGALKAAILGLYSLLMNSFDKIIEFCRGKWTIPLVTDLWEELTRSDFTLINFVSYVAAQVLELCNPKSTPALEGMGLSAFLSDPSWEKIPPIIPESITRKSGRANRGDGDSATEGTTLMAPELVFNLMTSTEVQRPSRTARTILAFARAGKTLSRSTNVGLQGFLQLSSGGAGGKGSGSSGSVGDGIELSDWKKAFEEPQPLTTSSAGAGTGVGVSRKGSMQDDVKSLLIQNSIFGLSCRVVEQWILWNHYTQAGRDAENFDGNCVETLASLVGLVLLCGWGDKPGVLGFSNMITSVGCFAGSWMAEQKEFYHISQMIGSSSSALASGLFLLKEPTCQTAAWVGVVIDGLDGLVLCAWLCWGSISVSQDQTEPGTLPPTTGPSSGTTGNIGPLKGDTHDVGKDKPKKKGPKPKLRVVDEPSDGKARQISGKLRVLLNSQGWFTHNAQGCDFPELEQLIERCCNHSLKHIVHGRDWEVDGKQAIATTIESYEHNAGPLIQRLNGFYEPKMNGHPIKKGKSALGPYIHTMKENIDEIQEELQELQGYIAVHYEEHEA